MGASRDLTEEVKQATRKNYDDPSLDKYHLAGCSPYELLAETKGEKMRELPPQGWSKQRDTGLQRDFLALPQEEKVFLFTASYSIVLLILLMFQQDAYGFEYDLMELLKTLVSVQDMNIQSEKDKIAMEQMLPPEIQEQLTDLELKMKELTDAAEEAGENGDVDAAAESHEQAQALRYQAEQL